MLPACWRHPDDRESGASTARRRAVRHTERLPPAAASPSLAVDPKAEVEELLRQATELDDNWDNLTPAQRNQQIAALRQQADTVQREVDNLPPNEQPEVQGMLNLVALRLAHILQRQLTSR